MPSSIICSVDTVLLTLKDNALHVALFKREKAPFKGEYALPGGYVHAQADADTGASALRVLNEKTGLASPYIEQLATFSGPGRDPRGWSVSVAYFALVPLDELLSLSPATMRLIDVSDTAQLQALPFDHAKIVGSAVERVRSKSAYSSLPAHLCGPTFTLPQLQTVYEMAIGEPINKVSFRRKMEEMDLVEPVTGAMEQGKKHRPAQLYQLKPKYAKELSVTDRAFNPG